MAETSQKKITLSNFFEQIVEINKVSQEALKKSNESVSISEKTRIDLEKLIATLKINFDREVQNVEAQVSSKDTTNIINRNDNRQILNIIKEQRSSISSLIREDAVEDRELRDSFLELQSSFRDLSSAVGILRNDLSSLSNAFVQMQQGRSRALKRQGRSISKEEDTLQKEQILGGISGQSQQKGQSENYKRQQEQKENKMLSSLKQFLAGGLLTGLGAALGGGDPSTSPSGGAPTTEQQKEVANIMGAEFRSQGLSNDGVNLALAEIGRENSLNRNTILGTHDDNGVTAYGAVSWQGGREKVLLDELKSRGIDPTVEGLKGSGDEGLRANAAAMIKEMRSRGHTELLGLLEKSDLTDEEKDRARQLFKDQYFVYNKSIPTQRSRDWYDTVTRMQKEQTIERHKELRQQLESERPSSTPRSEAEKKEIEERHKKLRELSASPLSPQSSITPQKREGVPDLQRPSASIASINLPPMNAGTQQVGGQGRGQASTQSYAVQSSRNPMMFAQVLTTSFSDKMNIVVG